MVEFLEDAGRRIGGALSAPGWILGALTVGLLLSPKARKGARKLIVRGLAASMTAAYEARQFVAKAGKEWHEMVEEASAPKEQKSTVQPVMETQQTPTTVSVPKLEPVKPEPAD